MVFVVPFLVTSVLNFIFLYLPQYPASNTEFSSEFLELEQLKDLGSALLDALQGEPDEKLSRYCRYSFFYRNLMLQQFINGFPCQIDEVTQHFHCFHFCKS